MRFLSALYDAVLPPREDELLVRTLQKDDLLSIMDPVYVSLGAAGATSLLPYADMRVQACIREAKFEGSRHAAALLGACMGEFLYELCAQIALSDKSAPLLIPLPLSKGRQKERGYNQTERILETASDKYAFCIDSCLLLRTKETKPQTSLDAAARRTNLEYAFCVSRSLDPERTYIAVDDVITTGHTMRSALVAMRAAGAAKLLAVSLAY